MQKDNPGTSRLESADDSINQENKEQQVLQHIWTLGLGGLLRSYMTEGDQRIFNPLISPLLPLLHILVALIIFHISHKSILILNSI